MKPTNFGPIYACMYPKLSAIAREHGYALAAHGSLARDFDLVCIPWIDRPFPPAFVVEAMCAAFAVREVGEPETKQHGRVVYTLTLTFGECFLDLSFMPASEYQ